MAQLSIKGDGNVGEPDAHRKLEFKKRPKIGWNEKIMDGLG